MDGAAEAGARSGVLRLGERVFPPGRCAVMAVINRTPDSFYDRGAAFEFTAALRAVDAAVSRGADLVDVGGVKAGYGQDVDEAEEIRRTVDFLAEVRERHPGVVLSVDTWRARVAERCAEAGVDLINDTWAGADPDLVRVAAEHDLGLVCSHTGGLPPRTDPHRPAYGDVVAETVQAVQRLADRAVAAGVGAERILIDPTHDFGKNTYHSLLLTRGLHRLVATGWPVLVAVSNKDFVGEALDAPVAHRGTGTLATLAVAAWQGARVVRVHDVAASRAALDAVASL